MFSNFGAKNGRKKSRWAEEKRELFSLYLCTLLFIEPVNSSLEVFECFFSIDFYCFFACLICFCRFVWIQNGFRKRKHTLEIFLLIFLTAAVSTPNSEPKKNEQNHQQAHDWLSAVNGIRIAYQFSSLLLFLSPSAHWTPKFHELLKQNDNK